MRWLESIENIVRDNLYIADIHKDEYEDMYGVIRDDTGRLERKRLLDIANVLGVVKDDSGTNYKQIDRDLIKLLELVNGLELVNPKKFDSETSVADTEFYTVFKGNRVVFYFRVLQKLDDLGVFWEGNPQTKVGTKLLTLLDIYLLISKYGLNLSRYDVYISSMGKLYRVEINNEIVSLVTKVGILRR